MGDSVPPGFLPVALGGGFSGALGPVFVDRARAVLGWRVGEAHVNPVGMCHGGALATFADAQLAAVMEILTDSAGHTPTISLSVDYLAPIPEGSWVEAAVVIDRMTRTMIFSHAAMTVGNETVARASAIYRKPHRTGQLP
jgi:uncharacterized protein (TIGR00369 family)